MSNKKNLNEQISRIKSMMKMVNDPSNLFEGKKTQINENVMVDINKLINIAQKMAESKMGEAKWDDYVKSFVDVFEFIDLNEEQSSLVFNWFRENFPSAPNHRLSKYLPSLNYDATEYEAEGGFANDAGWDDDPNMGDNSDSWEKDYDGDDDERFYK